MKTPTTEQVKKAHDDFKEATRPIVKYVKINSLLFTDMKDALEAANEIIKPNSDKFKGAAEILYMAQNCLNRVDSEFYEWGTMMLEAEELCEK